jgi:hypothetical protein
MVKGKRKSNYIENKPFMIVQKLEYDPLYFKVNLMDLTVYTLPYFK